MKTSGVTSRQRSDQHAVKVLYVLSRSSNQKEGPLLELKVAHDVRKKESFSDFVIPLHIDDPAFNEINIQLSNLNAIDCRAAGRRG